MRTRFKGDMKTEAKFGAKHFEDARRGHVPRNVSVL